MSLKSIFIYFAQIAKNRVKREVQQLSCFSASTAIYKVFDFSSWQYELTCTICELFSMITTVLVWVIVAVILLLSAAINKQVKPYSLLISCKISHKKYYSVFFTYAKM